MTSSEVRVFTLDSKPEGTAFFELLPRRYEGVCWNQESLYVEEEVFGLIEPIIYQSVSTYDHYAFTELRPAEVEKITSGLKRFADQLERNEGRERLELGYLFQETEARVWADWPAIRPKLLELSRTLHDWFSQNLTSGNVVTLMGI